jgi:hypothetical protein
MIEFDNLQSLQKLLNWFKVQTHFPKAVLTGVEMDPREPAANVIPVRFGGDFSVVFFGGVVDIEDICRCHNDDGAMQAVRKVIAAFLGDEDTFNITDGTSWDDIGLRLKEDIHAFAVFYGR